MNEKKLLDEIFSITHRLYAEMCLSDGDPEKYHLTIFRLLTELAGTLVNADRASLWKWDKRAHILWTTAAVGLDRVTIPDDTGLVGRALRKKEAIIANDPYNDPDFNADVDKSTGYVTKSILVMPISNCRGEVIGVYQAINKLSDDEKFDRNDIARLSMAAFICGLTLESEIFMNDSQHDKLTDLKNRTGFYSDYNSAYKKMLADGKNVSLFICDIDFFKKVNDTYGHNAGDAVLRSTASVFRNSLPYDCTFYRWGGEEFICVLPGRDLKKAAETAEKLRLKIMDSACEFEKMTINITMSFGVTELDGELSAEDNIKDADKKLYTAKEGGRNRVIS